MLNPSFQIHDRVMLRLSILAMASLRCVMFWAQVQLVLSLLDRANSDLAPMVERGREITKSAVDMFIRRAACFMVAKSALSLRFLDSEGLRCYTNAINCTRRSSSWT